ncbi:MAG: exosortase/archaeosortase family protein [archaeon]
MIFALLHLIVWSVDLSFLENSIASFEAGLTGLESNGNIIAINAQKIEINPSCTGLISISILAAVIFSLRKPELKKKIIIFAAGGISLLLLNLLRVYFVIVVGKTYGIAAGEIAHELSWLSTAIFIIVLWYYLTKRITGTKSFNELV